MRIVNISQFGDSLVLHFETEGRSINAYTLASTLVSIADAARAANSAINFGYDIEIVVEALGPGSFRAKIKVVFVTSRNLFSKQSLQTVILSIVASFIYQRTLSVDDSVTVKIKTDEVIIQRGEDRVIVPRSIYDATREAEKNPQFVHAVEKTMKAIGCDERVSGFGFVREMDSPPPEILVPKSVLQSPAIDVEDDPLTRIVVEQCSLYILKAILEKSRRKWEFVRDGYKIAAPILDDKFHTEFSAHDITIAPGDVLKVLLAIKQRRDAKTGIYINVAYEVTSVIEHIPGSRQVPLDYESDS